MAEAQALRAALTEAREMLTDVSDTPLLDAQLLLMRTLGVPRAYLLAHPETELKADQAATFHQFVKRCASGEALPHVIGWWEFFGRQFYLDHSVLIPRPETEHLVALGLERLQDREDLRRVLDVGTGSGCIVISLAIEFPGRNYIASDRSWSALRVASKNLREYQLRSTVHLVQADMLGAVYGPFDLIMANLPYIPSKELDSLEVGRREPRLALDGGRDGLEALRRLAKGLRRSLRPGGELLLELDPGQMEEAKKILDSAITIDQAEIHRDLAGKQRVLQLHRDPADGMSE
ncbi:MAG: peptide chain release factor N(5)-glutamine methyltransferase [Anaerolineales bacterium]